MKWLLLLVLISCGKHEQPATVDLRDSDGDSTPNFLETEKDKFIADYQALGSISGVMNFHANESYDLKFSNLSDIKNEALKLMIGDVDLTDKDSYFSEWSELIIETENKKFSVNTGTNTIYLKFSKPEHEPDEIVLITGKIIKKLSHWQQYSRLIFTKEELDNILNKKSVLAVRKAYNKKEFDIIKEESIKQKTTKVFKHDGIDAKILYISKDLSEIEIQNVLEVKDATIVNDEILFLNINEESELKWFKRQYENGDSVYLYTTIQDIKKIFLEKFKTQKMNLKRENGRPTTTLTLNNIKNNVVYLKVRPSKTTRTFVTSHRTEKHRSGGMQNDNEWKCTYYSRDIKTETSTIPVVADFWENLENLNVIENNLVLEQVDEKGIYWEVILHVKTKDLTLKLLPRPNSTYTITGDYDSACNKDGKALATRTPYSTNDEGKLSFEIESYVEKMN